MNGQDPHHFALCQADQAREAYAEVMEELDLVKEQVARLPTRGETLMLSDGLAGRRRGRAAAATMKSHSSNDPNRIYTMFMGMRPTCSRLCTWASGAT
jgi:hypothetical protein